MPFVSSGGCERIEFDDPTTGAHITQMTSFPVMSMHFYYEHPSFAADSRTLIYRSMRSTDRTCRRRIPCTCTVIAGSATGGSSSAAINPPPLLPDHFCILPQNPSRTGGSFLASYQSEDKFSTVGLQNEKQHG